MTSRAREEYRGLAIYVQVHGENPAGLEATFQVWSTDLAAAEPLLVDRILGPFAVELDARLAAASAARAAIDQLFSRTGAKS